MPIEAPLILSTTDFHARVHSLRPTIAVFDCDGTLWSGDAGSSFMWWTIEQGLLSAERIAWMRSRYDGYLQGQVSELAICGEMVQLYAGIAVATMRQAAARFFREQIEPNIFPEMLQLITELQHNQVDIWAVSSTCDWVVEEGVKRFNIPANRVLAACVAPANDVATDKLLDVPTDEGKVASLRRAGVTAPEAVFGNSVHDAAMLAFARSRNGTSAAFPVNPSTALAERAAAEGWPVYYPASVAQVPR